MAPTRKSRGVNRRYIDEVSPSKDGDSAKRSNSRKRKSSDMLGPRWTLEELTRFYDAYRKYGKDWKKVAGAVRNRSPEMVEAIFTMNRAYLSLPHGTASSDGLIAMMTDHYSILGGSDSERESSDGAGPSKKTQKRVRRKTMHTDSKTPDDQFVSNTQILASDYGFLSSSKKKRSGGSRPCPVGKRTPRFPVSFSYENDNGDMFVSPTRQGLKLSATANDDEVAHEIAKALADASLRGGSPQLSRTPSKILERVKSSPSRHAQRKYSLVEDLEGSAEADTDELSRNKSFMKGSLNTVTLRKKERKPERKKFEVGNDNENYLIDVKEECSGTEEEELYGTMRGMSKDTKISGHRQKKKSKKIQLRKDEAPAIDALLTLADLSFMMPKEDNDDPLSSDSRVQFKDDDDEHVDELVSSGALAMQPSEEKHIYSGVKLKGSRSEVVSSKALRPGKESVKVSSVAEDNKGLHQSVSKTSRRKQKMSMYKIRKADAQPDSQLSESTEIEAGGAGKSKNKNSSRNGSLNLKNSGYDDESNLRKGANVPAQSASIPTKVWSRRKVHLKKSEAQENVNFPDKISNEHSSLPSSALHDRSFKEKLSSCLEHPSLRRWCIHEWFYSAIDYPWFAKREFNEYLYHVGLNHMPRLTRVEWGVIRSSLGNPRRFSEQFLKEEKEKLNQYRDSVREHYNELREGVRKGLPTDLARPLSVGQRVIAIHPKTREIHDGSVLTVDYSRCRVQFDRHELGVEFVMDIDCMPLNPFENMPAWLGRQTSAVDRYFENHNEKKINGRAEDLMRIFPGDNVNNADGISHLSPLANPGSLLKQSKEYVNHDSVHQVASANAHLQTTHSYMNTIAQIQAKEADVQALSGLTRALDKKEAVVVELRRLNDDVFENQKDDDSSLKDSEPFKKHYAAVLVLLNEANEQVSSALYCLRQRNTYVPHASPRQGTKSADPCDGFSLDHPLCPHANEIIDSSRTKARVMVAAAMQAMASLKDNDGSNEKIEEAIDYVNDRLPWDDSGMHMSPDLKPGNVSDIEAQIPSDMISKCVATLLMIQKCTERQFPPSEVARVLDSAVTSLHPRSSQNLAIYSEIQKCMGIIRNKIMALIPT